ncbi:type II toxin-antitoxin system RelE/ParE family toxin [Microvirga massiliensis]|uniref:type II toxin-antitoxin system RelE/ParE family toxin n=1 Tax=Microvirga massiliensis TaxID=1033741 RepID=UPI00062B604B|nr:type II toxin-antitoxin system RelE/ParE family toxin [Microvirga massiliensis]
MRLFLTKEFARLARKNDVGDADLREAVRRAESGLVDADIGANLIKQRIARKGEGRSGGFRTIVFYKAGDRAVFLHLFAKNQQANLSDHERDAYREFAKFLAGLTTETMAALVHERGWKEIQYEAP